MQTLEPPGLMIDLFLENFVHDVLHLFGESGI